MTQGAGAAQPAMILVGPQMGENIGAAARAMWNFGLDQMRIVAPRDGWPNPKAEAMASGAGRLLDEAMLTQTTAEACADLTHVFATTARDRALTKRVLTPERAMEEAREMVAAGERVGILFGPERAGLSRDDVVRANDVISVPVNPAFGSLNLAQCVLLLSYEWGRGALPAEPADYRLGGARLAKGGEVDAFVERLVTQLDSKDFFYPEEKRRSMIANLDNLFRRAPLTDADVRTLHGIVRALSEGSRRN
ncbi:RNA methyltransferase [Amaricoccus macauensis]|uniref:RNA methyltransferase n=1 Tax=Amaricoccus macauensis TaxID=57001 RepID=UPI003C7DD622